MHVQNHPQKKRNENDEQKEQTVKKKNHVPGKQKGNSICPFLLDGQNLVPRESDHK